jgi:pimeloyl-ACP methyl ester carboxylesterase
MSDRYPGCRPYPGSTNHHGEIEMLGDVEATHWFVEVVRSRYHFVTAGDPGNPPVVMLHGIPETWYTFHNQVRDLSDDYYVVAVDLKGYGQSEKRPDGEYSFPHCAFELALLLEKLGIERFYLVGHDRGSVLADHLCNVPGRFNERIIKYARMQQSGPKPHTEPRPPHALFASAAGTELFLSDFFPRIVYTGLVPVPGSEGVQYVQNEIPEDVLDRLDREWKHPGAAQAVPLCFKHTNFDIEMEDRQNFLFAKMTMPVRLIQGELDPGQPPSDFEGLEALGANFSIVWIKGAGHFQHLEKPEATTQAIRAFFAEP